MLLVGTGTKKLKMEYSQIDGAVPTLEDGRGIPNLMRRYKQTKSNHIRD